MANETHHQFRIVLLESDHDDSTHSSSGPWGTDITSSFPVTAYQFTSGDYYPLKILPRENERSIDPQSLRVPKH